MTHDPSTRSGRSLDDVLAEVIRLKLDRIAARVNSRVPVSRSTQAADLTIGTLRYSEKASTT